MSSRGINLGPYVRRGTLQLADVNPQGAAVEVPHPGLAGMLAVTAGALEDFSKVFAQAGQAEDETLLADTLLDAQEKTLQLGFDVESQPDPAAARGIQSLGEKNIREAAREKLKNRPDLQEKFKQRFGLFRMRNSLGMGQTIFVKERQGQVAGFERRLRESDKLYSMDPMNNASVSSSLISGAENLEASGVINPIEKEQYVARIIGQVEPQAWKNALWDMASSGKAHEAVDLLGEAMGPGNAAVFVAGKESNKNPAAIGYDSNGGTSYGAFQIASKPGTIDMFLGWLKENGLTGAADFLKAAGPANTGGQSGGMVDAWKTLVEESILTYDVQRKFIEDTHIKPVLDHLSPEQRQLIQNDAGLTTALYSTAVQHGSGGAQKLIASALQTGGESREEIINSLYGNRTTQFGSSTPETQAAIKVRLDKERQEVLAMAGPGYSKNAARLREIMPAQDMFVLRSKLTTLAEAQGKAAREQFLVSSYTQAFDMARGMQEEDRDAFMADSALSLPAPMRDDYWKMYEDDKKILKARQGSTDAKLRRDFLAEAENMSMPKKMHTLSGLREKGMSEESITSLEKEIIAGPTWDDPDDVQAVIDKVQGGLYLDKADFLRDVGRMQISSSRRTELEKLLDKQFDYGGLGFDRMLKSFTDNLDAFGIDKEQKSAFTVALTNAIELREQEFKRNLTRGEIQTIISELLVEATKLDKSRAPAYMSMMEIPAAALPSIDQAARAELDDQGIVRPVSPYDRVRIWNLPENEALRQRYSTQNMLGIPDDDEEEEQIRALMLDQGVQP